MSIIRYTLLADGTSDKALIPIVDWLIKQHAPDRGVQPQFAKLGKVGLDLSNRILAALEQFPCDIMFIHRDGETQTYNSRLEEIDFAWPNLNPKYVPLIPIRMMEAWLFSDEGAIRAAAGNRNGTMNLMLPPKKEWESRPDPKKLLSEALITASGKTGRSLRKFNPEHQRHRITELTQNFSALRGIPSFDLFESSLIEQLKSI